MNGNGEHREAQNFTPLEPEKLQECHTLFQRISRQIGDIVIGRAELLEQLLVALLCGGHVVIEGVPGSGKKLLARLLAECFQLSYSTLELTPDVLPGDVLGRFGYYRDPATGKRHFGLVRGPVFANVLLVEHLERCRPKTQASLLSLMQEGRIRIGGQVYSLPDPFLVIVIRDKHEQDHMYPLLPASWDRFLLYLKADYPEQKEEWQIARRATGPLPEFCTAVASAEIVRALRQQVRRVKIDDQVLGYAWALVRASRPHAEDSPDFVDRWIARGSGPRGLVSLILAAKARALLQGRGTVEVEDIQQMVKPALRHRIVGNEAAQSQALSSDKLIDMLLEAVRPDQYYPAPKEISDEL